MLNACLWVHTENSTIYVIYMSLIYHFNGYFYLPNGEFCQTFNFSYAFFVMILLMAENRKFLTCNWCFKILWSTGHKIWHKMKVLKFSHFKSMKKGFVYFLTRFLSLLYEYLGQTHIIDVLMSFCESDKIENFSKRPKSESADE